MNYLCIMEKSSYSQINEQSKTNWPVLQKTISKKLKGKVKKKQKKTCNRFVASHTWHRGILILKS